MYIHEYQSKRLLHTYEIPVPRSEVFTQGDSIEKFVANFGGESWIVKAQVHAGGRGKAGGILWTHTKEELKQQIDKLMGTRLVTKQTDADGLPIQTLLVEKPANIKREIYLGLLVDRASKKITAIASAEGGINIEEVAETSPEKIASVNIHKTSGVQGYHCRLLAQDLSLNKAQFKQFSHILKQVYTLFLDSDASLIEINPLIVAEDESLLALDAKMNFDDNALFRHKKIASLKDTSQENPIELKAKQHDLNYVKLDGSIGCIVNGAGLAMATMDLIKHNGGEPANFLDVGGNTTAQRVTQAFNLLIDDESVRSIFVNIFGGIVRCDVIAEGILQALEETELTLPVVVLLQGTNAEQGKEILKDKHKLITAVSELTEGAKLAIEKAGAQS
ncbi:MAG: ADP-forming succinate--CoA ligase subunit beta [Gammaproteobacteria bacterium]